MSRFQNTEGFTFLELLITMTVIVISLAFAAPSISDWGPSQRLTSNVQEVKSKLQFARMEAIKRTQPISVFFNSGEPESLVVFQDIDGDGLVDAGESITDYSLSEEVDYGKDGGVANLPGTDFAGDVIIYQTDGSLRDAAGNLASGQVYINFDALKVDIDPSLFKTHAVSISPSGAVISRKWKNSLWN